MKRYHMIAKGRVQNVGFRYHVYQAALTYDCTGWVRNLDDGTVEFAVQGDDDDLYRFEVKVMNGNGYCRVDELIQEETEVVLKEDKFRIAN